MRQNPPDPAALDAPPAPRSLGPPHTAPEAPPPRSAPPAAPSAERSHPPVAVGARVGTILTLALTLTLTRYNLFSDPEIITLPSSLGWLNGPIATIISKTRAPTSREGYAAIGGGSPQLATTIKQGEALEAAMLNLHGVEAGQPVN